jgi:hypothetical protein
MVDDWLFGSIRHEVSGLLSPNGQGLLQHDKDRSEGDWILANIYLIVGVAKSWLNPHMRYYQGLDPNIRTLGFLSFHRQVQYFLMLEDLKKIEDSWREMDEFAAFLVP